MIHNKKPAISSGFLYFTGPCRTDFWLRGRDLNPRPSGYEPDELPDCSTPRHLEFYLVPRGQLLVNRNLSSTADESDYSCGNGYSGMTIAPPPAFTAISLA